MKQIFTIFLFIILSSNYICAQDTLTIFYDSDWNEISDQQAASFYRKAVLKKNKGWVINDYYKSNILQMSGVAKFKDLEVKHGHFVYYFEDGSKKSEGDFQSNKKVGEWNYWADDGSLKTNETFEDGLFVASQGFYKTGSQKYSGKYQRGERHGEWNWWNIDGRKTFQGNYKNGKRDGEWIRYFPDGEKKYLYCNDVVVGKAPGSIITK